MNANWKTLPLGEVLELVIDHRGKTPKKLGFNDFHQSGYPVLSAKHVKTGGLVNLEAIRYANQVMYSKWMKVPVQKGDVVLTSEAPMGETYFIDGSVQYVLGQRVFGLRPKTELLEPLYLQAWLSSASGQAKLRERATGSTVQGIKQSELLKIDIEIPPLSVQKVIAENQSSFTSKIQLNQQINQTLEQMAKAIFKSWFVDFEAVKAKIATLDAGGSEDNAMLAAMQAISGKDIAALARLQTEHPDQYNELRTTAELFPSAMHDSELGEIPVGWSTGTLNDLAHLNKNIWSKRTLPTEIDYVDLANTKNGVIETVTKYLSDDAPSRARRILSEDDTIIGTVRPGNRSFAFIKRSSSALTGSTGFAVLTPKHKALSEFVYIVATCDESINHLAHLADGGAYPAIRSDVVASLTSIIPTGEILHRFHDLVRPYFECVANLKIESASLELTRYALLPKLLSGELTITEAKDAENVDVLN